MYRRADVPAPPFKGGVVPQLRLNSKSRSGAPPLSSSKVQTRSQAQLLPVITPKVSPRPVNDPAQVEVLRNQLLKLEARFHEASRLLLEQSETHARDRDKVVRLESECERLRQIVETNELKRINMKDIAVQTNSAPPPLAITRIRTRRAHTPQPLAPTVPDPPQVLRAIENVTPLKPVAAPEKPPTPIQYTQSPMSAGKRVSAIASRFGSAVTARPKSASVSRRSLPPSQQALSGNAEKAYALLGEIMEENQETISGIVSQFDKLDGGKCGALPRDLCLALVSLVLEERGLRHVSIPTVICSKLLKEVINSKSSVLAVESLPPTPGRLADGLTSRTVNLRRDHVPEFFKLALEFIIDQER